MSTLAVIFDVDGTLVDSNRLHAEAWARTFARHGHAITAEQVLPHIGKGGDKLVPSLLPHASPDEQQALRADVSGAFRALADERGIPRLPGVPAVFAALRERGVRTAVATSAKRQDFETVIRTSGFDPGDHVDALLTGDDVDASKPDPDLIAAAVARLRVAPARAAMVGDTPYDALAARRAGAVAVGLLTGAHDADALRAGGATHVFSDAAALTARIDEVLRALSG